MKTYNKPLIIIFFISLFLQGVIPLFAQSLPAEQINDLRNDPKFYEVDPNSFSVNFLGVEESQEVQNKFVAPDDRAITVIDVSNIKESLNQIVNIAKKAWKIVDDSKPVSNVQTTYAAALPYGVKSSQLTGWWSKSYLYGFYVKNLYGIKTVEVTYKVSFMFKGGYKGQGKYLTGVTVTPVNVDTMAGYSFYMSASVPDSTIINVGTYENPVAALNLVLQWRISTIIKDSQSTAVYYMTGTGDYKQIANPFSRSAASDVTLPVINVVDVPAAEVKQTVDTTNKPAVKVPTILKRDPATIF